VLCRFRRAATKKSNPLHRRQQRGGGGQLPLPAFPRPAPPRGAKGRLPAKDSGPSRPPKSRAGTIGGYYGAEHTSVDKTRPPVDHGVLNLRSPTVKTPTRNAHNTTAQNSGPRSRSGPSRKSNPAGRLSHVYRFKALVEHLSSIFAFLVILSQRGVQPRICSWTNPSFCTR